MRFSVRSIINTPGGELPFAFSMDLSDLDFGGSRPIAEPVEVTGGVRNRLDVLELTLQAKTTLHCVCDRCAKPFLQEKEVQWQCVLATEKQNEDNDDIVLLEDGEFVDAGGSGPDRLPPRDGHKNVVFPRLQGALSPVRG